jgi:hypothetical protein
MMTILHRFAAASYADLTPDTPSLCGEFTVRDMDFDPRTETGVTAPCERCESLAADWTEFYLTRQQAGS